MFSKQVTLLVGNGPNRLSESAVSWNDVLARMAQYVQPQVRLSGKPLTLAFEEIAFRLQRGDQPYEDKLKLQLAAEMRNLVPNSIHRRIMGLGLTTGCS